MISHAIIIHHLDISWYQSQNSQGIWRFPKMRLPQNHPAIGVSPFLEIPIWCWQQPLLTCHRLEPRMHRFGVCQLRHLHRWHGRRGVPAAPVVVHCCIGLPVAWPGHWKDQPWAVGWTRSWSQRSQRCKVLIGKWKFYEHGWTWRVDHPKSGSGFTVPCISILQPTTVRPCASTVNFHQPPRVHHVIIAAPAPLRLPQTPRAPGGARRGRLRVFHSWKSHYSLVTMSWNLPYYNIIIYILYCI